MITLARLLQEETNRLHEAAVDAPRRSAELLAEHCFGWDRVGLILHAEEPLADAQVAAFRALTARRAQGEPVAYLRGSKEFYGRDFLVTPATLIPRPETEHLVDKALELLPETFLTFADMGTGSGCLAVTLAAERPHWRGVMLDISQAALNVACRNARAAGVAARLLALRGDMAAPPLAAASLDLCVSNPPYIAEKEQADMSREVLAFEPAGALFSARDGLHHLTALAGQAAHLLRPGGLLLMEHGAAQGPAVHQMLHSMPCWHKIEICKDYAGLNRFCQAYKKM